MKLNLQSIAIIVLLLVFLVGLSVLILTIIDASREIVCGLLDKSDCMWTVCNGQDIQHCNWNEYLVSEHCGNGCFVSDTWYDSTNNTCHLTMCENSLFSSGDCTYEGRKR